jgi:hypothetical protein
MCSSVESSYPGSYAGFARENETHPRLSPCLERPNWRASGRTPLLPATIVCCGAAHRFPFARRTVDNPSDSADRHCVEGSADSGNLHRRAIHHARLRPAADRSQSRHAAWREFAASPDHRARAAPNSPTAIKRLIRNPEKRCQTFRHMTKSLAQSIVALKDPLPVLTLPAGAAVLRGRFRAKDRAHVLIVLPMTCYETVAWRASASSVPGANACPAVFPEATERFPPTERTSSAHRE